MSTTTEVSEPISKIVYARRSILAHQKMVNQQIGERLRRLNKLEDQLIARMLPGAADEMFDLSAVITPELRAVLDNPTWGLPE